MHHSYIKIENRGPPLGRTFTFLTVCCTPWTFAVCLLAGKASAMLDMIIKEGFAKKGAYHNPHVLTIEMQASSHLF